MSKKSKVLGLVERVLDRIFKSEDKKIEYADCIIRNAAGEILLLQRSTNDDFMPGKWCLPGGKVDPGEDSNQSAPRELMEEVGIAVPLSFIKTIHKTDPFKCSIHYYQGLLNENFSWNSTNNEPFLPILDNEEHFRYEFVPFENLDRYDLLLDLESVLTLLRDDLYPIVNYEPQYSNIEVAIANNSLNNSLGTVVAIKKSFDDGMIEEDDYLAYLQVESALQTITKAYDQELITEQQFFDALEKSKHYEFVKVVRDGKQFYQYREVGTDKVDLLINQTTEKLQNDSGLVLKSEVNELSLSSIDNPFIWN